MSIQKGFGISSTVVGDGVSNSVVVDLLKDPYNVATSVNWFALDRHAATPTGVIPIDGNSYSLSGTILTIVFASIPTNGQIVGWDCLLLF